MPRTSGHSHPSLGNQKYESTTTLRIRDATAIAIAVPRAGNKSISCRHSICSASGPTSSRRSQRKMRVAKASTLCVDLGLGVER